MNNVEPLNIDNLIFRLINSSNNETRLTESELRLLSRSALEVLRSQPILLQLKAPMKIAGDIHGQFQDLINIFQGSGFPDEHNYLFLGDYVDRGRQSVESLALLLCYKLKHPENFFLLRVNHECSSINRIYGFYDECKFNRQAQVLSQTLEGIYRDVQFPPSGRYY